MAEKKRETGWRAGAEASVTHGGYRLQSLRIEDWPKELQEIYHERCSEILQLEHIDPIRHKFAVRQYVQCEIIVQWCTAWLFKHGLVQKEGKPQPLLNVLIGWVNSLHRQAQTLNLTPQTSKKYQKSGETLAEILSALPEAEEVIDGIEED